MFVNDLQSIYFKTLEDLWRKDIEKLDLPMPSEGGLWKHGFLFFIPGTCVPNRSDLSIDAYAGKYSIFTFVAAFFQYTYRVVEYERQIDDEKIAFSYLRSSVEPRTTSLFAWSHLTNHSTSFYTSFFSCTTLDASGRSTTIRAAKIWQKASTNVQNVIRLAANWNGRDVVKDLMIRQKNLPRVSHFLN